MIGLVVVPYPLEPIVNRRTPRPKPKKKVLRGPLLAPDPTHAKLYAAGGAIVGGVIGGWAGSKAGALAGTVGGALGLGFLAWYYFSGRGVPSASQLQTLF